MIGAGKNQLKILKLLIGQPISFYFFCQ